MAGLGGVPAPTADVSGGTQAASSGNTAKTAPFRQKRMDSDPIPVAFGLADSVGYGNMASDLVASGAG
jgi:hypothetical protein